jgi:hypothetical protein
MPVPIPDPAAIADETFIHLFFECTHSIGPINNFFRTYLNDMALDNIMKKKTIFISW